MILLICACKPFFQIISDATALAFKPDGQQVAVATMNGQITFFNPTTGQQMGGIEGRGDLAVGRQDTDLIKPQKAQARLYIYTRKYPLRGYILGVLTHTTAWDRHWGGDITLDRI